MTLLLLLFATGMFAGTVDAIAGGGGMISLPMLLSIGMPPHIAFGTNKFQGTIGTLVATHRYYKHGLISLPTIYHGVIFGMVGSIAGSITAQVVSSQLLRTIIPVLLAIILLYTIFTPRLGTKDEAPRMSEFWFYIVFGFSLGFYDGFFGPGTGSFWVFLLAFFLGYNLIKATAYTKVFNLNSSFIAAICFALGGNIDYRFGLAMAAGQLIGGKLGAHLAIKRGAQLIRPVFLTIVSATIITLLGKTFLSPDKVSLFLRQYNTVSTIFIVASVSLGLLMIYRKRAKRLSSST